MGISRRTDYAVRALIHIAAHDGFATTREIAEEQDIPAAFLAKIVASLGVAGIVEASRGPAGGVHLRQPAEALTLWDIVRSCEGLFCLNICSMDSARCPRASMCAVQPVWALAQRQMEETLSGVTLSDMVEAQARLVSSDT